MINKNILVTGSSGFIGFHLCRYLLSKNFSIIGIDSHNKYYSQDLKKKRLSILKKNKKFYFVKINLNNKKKLEKIFNKHGPNTVFHLAGQPGVLYSFKNPKSYYYNNVKATKTLCNISKKYSVNKFIFGSSSSVYGDQKKFPIKETINPNPKNYYAKTKLKSEKIVYETFKKSQTKFIIFRFFTVYGPYGRPDMFIHKFLNVLKKNKEIKLHNSGLNFRDFTYIKDVVKILLLAIKTKLNGKILNISRCYPIRTDKLVYLILKYYKKNNVKIKKIDFVKGEMLKTHGSNSKLKKFFGRIKFTDIKDGIKQTIKVFKKNGF